MNTMTAEQTEPNCVANYTIRAIMYMFFPGGGIGRYTHELAEQLHKLSDIDIEVACLRRYEFLDEAEYPTWPGLMRIHSEQTILRKARFLAAQLVSPKRVLGHAKETGADVLHLSNINHLTFPLWRRWIDSVDPLRIVATAHDVRRSKSIISKRWETKALRQFYESADALFIHSKQQRQDLLDFASVDSSRIHQVPMGTMPYAAPTTDRDTVRARLGIDKHRTVGLFFGNIRDDKNLDGLLTAVSMEKKPTFLIVAGRAGGAGNKNDAHYKQRIADLGLTDHVLFLDRFIENEEVGDLFHAADFIPLCYKTTFTSQSAVLNVAMHYDKPVVATPAPTLADTISNMNVGVVTESDDATSIADGIAQITAAINDNTSFNFAEYKRKNSWRENARITRDVYRSVLGHHNNRSNTHD